jgi:hypothetical protein
MKEIERERQAEGARGNLKAGVSPSAISRKFSAKEPGKSFALFPRFSF